MSLWPVSEGVPPLTGDGPQFDARPDDVGSESPLDLPLQDDQPAVAEPTLFQTPEAPRSSGRAVAIAGALVIGLLTGFTGGFLVGQLGGSLPEPRVAADVPAPVATSLDNARDVLSDRRRAPVDDARPAARDAQEPAAQTYTDAAVAERGSGIRDQASGTPEPQSVIPDPRPPVPDPQPGALQFASRPAGAQVFMDGVLVGKTPVTVADVKAGTHRVRLELPGHRTWATSVNVEGGGRVRVGASLERP